MATCPACGSDVPADREFCPACLASARVVAEPTSALPPPRPLPTAAATAPDVVSHGAEATHFLSAPRAPAELEHPCPLHPGYPVGGTCSRCGKFVCIRCDPELASTSLPMCEACRGRIQNETPEGIGGWLWLPFINLCLAPLGSVVQIFQAAAGIVRVTSLTPPRVGLAVLIGVEALFNAALFGYSIFTLVRFIQRRKEAPKLLIGLYVTVFAFAVLDSVAVSEMFPGHWSATEVAGRIARASIGLALWTPYLLTSQRVKKTFTR
jgi:hypothetical protein